MRTQWVGHSMVRNFFPKTIRLFDSAHRTWPKRTWRIIALIELDDNSSSSSSSSSPWDEMWLWVVRGRWCLLTDWNLNTKWNVLSWHRLVGNGVLQFTPATGAGSCWLVRSDRGETGGARWGESLKCTSPKLSINWLNRICGMFHNNIV